MLLTASSFKIKTTNTSTSAARDDSGSKLLVSLKPRHPYDLVAEPYTESTLWPTPPAKEEEIYDSHTGWYIYYNIDQTER